MIHRDTVLVLGAGASRPYGFPTGEELRRELLIQDQPQRIDEICEPLRCTPAEYLEFADRFSDSGLYSIDSFLAKQARSHPEIYALGTRAVALLIGEREKSDAMRYPPGGNEAWYRTLWHAMAGDVDSIEEVRKNPLQIVTFNYDRSLEYFLFSRAKAAFGIGDQEALDFVLGMNIQHIYGSLGKLALSNVSDARPYEPTVTADVIDRLVRNIRIITNERDAVEIGKTAQCFMKARQVCFLGFGFDNQNIARLGFAEAMDARYPAGGKSTDPLAVYATTVRIPPLRIEAIRERLHLPNPGTTWTAMNADISTALDEWHCFQLEG